MQLDCDISRLLEYFIFYVVIHDRITCIISAADAEHDADFGKCLKHNNKKILLH